MQFDRLNKKLQEESEQYKQNYNEQAWIKMEQLLEKHLPQMQERKRTFLLPWLFLLFIFLSVIFVLLSNPPDVADLFISIKQKVIYTPSLSNSVLINIDPALKKAINEGLMSKDNTLQRSPSVKMDALNKAEQFKEDNLPAVVVDKQLAGGGNFENSKVIRGEKQKEENATDVNVAKMEKETTVSSAQKFENTSTKKTVLRSNKNIFRGYVGFNLSAGPDVSAAAINDVGKINMMYGAGIVYQFKKRWNIRTGFYVVKKIYEAKPADYHPPASFTNANPDLIDIDANCKVYEVPIIIGYTLSQNAKHKLLTSAGFSSYLMKKEVYDYSVKNAAGQNQYSRLEIHNKNKHFLSLLRLSGGYEKKLSNKLSILAEPYVNLPLSGIGFGKVKLKSAGMMFTLGVNAFK